MAQDMWPILVNLPWALEKNMYSIFSCSVLWMSVRSHCLMILFSSSAHANFWSGRVCLSWKKGLKYPTVIVHLSIFPFSSQFLLCVFWSSVVRYIDVENYLLHYHYVIFFFIPGNFFALKSTLSNTNIAIPGFFS